MAVAVVDRFEVIEIAHDHADWMSRALRQEQFACEGFLEEVAAIKACQRVMSRLLTELFLQDLDGTLGPGAFGNIHDQADQEGPVADVHYAAVALDIYQCAILA